MTRHLTAIALAIWATASMAEVMSDGDVRVLRIRACADEELRAREDWEQEIIEHLEFASGLYERTWGVRFDIVEIVEWESDDSGQGMGDLVDELEEEIPTDGVDVVIGFSAQNPRRGKLSKYVALPWGLTPSLGRASMIRAMVDDESYDLHLAVVHEIAHLFGAFHVEQQESVMRETVGGPRTFQFDIENGKLMRLMRDYDFEAGVEAIPSEVADRITQVWKRGAVKHDSNPLAEALFNRGIELINEDDIEAAIDVWKRSAKADTTFAGVRGTMGITYSELGQYDEALRELRAADQLGWPDARQWIQYVRHQMDAANKPAGDEPEAVEKDLEPVDG